MHVLKTVLTIIRPMGVCKKLQRVRSPSKHTHWVHYSRSKAEHGIPDFISFMPALRARNPVFWPKWGIKNRGFRALVASDRRQVECFLDTYRHFRKLPFFSMWLYIGEIWQFSEMEGHSVQRFVSFCRFLISSKLTKLQICITPFSSKLSLVSLWVDCVSIL